MTHIVSSGALNSTHSLVPTSRRTFRFFSSSGLGRRYTYSPTEDGQAECVWSVALRQIRDTLFILLLTWYRAYRPVSRNFLSFWRWLTEFFGWYPDKLETRLDSGWLSKLKCTGLDANSSYIFRLIRKIPLTCNNLSDNHLRNCQSSNCIRISDCFWRIFGGQNAVTNSAIAAPSELLGKKRQVPRNVR